MTDYNVSWACTFARGLGPSPQFPRSLNDLAIRARFINELDAPFLVPSENIEEFLQHIGRRIRNISDISEKYIPDVREDLARVNIALRLWSGCLSAAKMIALETMDGPNTPEMRNRQSRYIDGMAERDANYKAGVEVAPEFKKLRGEPYSFDGIPESSLIRRYEG